MPFSRRRRSRRHGRRRHHGSLSFTIASEMGVPHRAMASPPTPYPGTLLGEDATAFFPISGVADDNGAYTTNVMAEVVQSGLIGTYHFDFTRLLAQSFGVVHDGTPFITLPGFFRRLRFGRGYMTIRRCDQGSQTMVMTSNNDADPPVPSIDTAFNPGNSPLPLKIHYIRYNAHEPSWSQFLINQRTFMADRRRRTVTLYPNKSVTFSFQAKRFRAPDYLAHTLRDGATGLAGEIDQYRRCEIPGRSTKLGWIPTQLAGYTNYVSDTSNRNPGLGSGLWRIVSPSIAFMVEVIQYSAFMAGVSVATPEITVPAIPTATVFAPMFTPFIRRSERCRVQVADLVQSSFGLNTGTGIPISRVGKVYTVLQWNQNSSVSPNTAECFDPPRISSLTSVEGVPPLYRDTESTGNFTAHTAPLDMQSYIIPPQSSFQVPEAGAKP